MLARGGAVLRDVERAPAWNRRCHAWYTGLGQRLLIAYCCLTDPAVPQQGYQHRCFGARWWTGTLKWARIEKSHIGGGWDIFVYVTETASVITACTEIPVTAEGAASSTGVWRSGWGWDLHSQPRRPGERSQLPSRSAVLHIAALLSGDLTDSLFHHLHRHECKGTQTWATGQAGAATTTARS